MRKRYENAHPGPEQSIQFESDEISLNIPMEGKDIPNTGWKLVPLKQPVVSYSCHSRVCLTFVVK